MKPPKPTKLPDRAALLPFPEERWAGHARVPALLSADGVLQPWGAEKWPAVGRETMVDVLVPIAAIADEAERERLSAETEVQLLPAKTEVRFRVSPSGVPENLTQFLLDGSAAYPDPGPMVAVILSEPLKLKIRPNRHSKLAPSTCDIPSIRATAATLNEAYTLLSVAFEPRRRSHGGSVYLQGYYLDEGFWLPLDALRRWVEAGRPSPIK